MHITLNGEAYQLESPLALTQLLKELGLSGKPIIVEHNRQALLPSHFCNTEIKPGDQLEIVALAAGG